MYKYKRIFKKVTILAVLMIFIVSTIAQAAPFDITQTNKQDSLRTISTALSSSGSDIANNIAKTSAIHSPLHKIQTEFEIARKALLSEAQQLLSFLAKTHLEKEAKPISKSDVGKVNPVILALGSPSPAAFKKAALDWKIYKEWGFEDVPVIASTGRGRGYKNFVIMTLEFLKQEDANNGTDYEQRFRDKYKSEIEKAETQAKDILESEYYSIISTNPKRNKPNLGAYVQLSENHDGNFNNIFAEIKDRKDKLTEAKVIAFIMEIYAGKEILEHMHLEELSNNTYDNIYESMKMIEEIEKEFNNGKAMKIRLVAASFHRLRALLATISICIERDKRNRFLERNIKDRSSKSDRPYEDTRARNHQWQINAEDSENAVLGSMTEETFYDYVMQTIGKQTGEIERLKMVYGGVLLEHSLKIRQALFLNGSWQQERVNNLRDKLLKYVKVRQGLYDSEPSNASSSDTSLKLYQGISVVLEKEIQNIKSPELQGIKDVIECILRKNLSIQKLADKLMMALNEYEKESNYNVNNIRAYEAKELFGIKQVILSLDIFYNRVAPFIEHIQIEEKQRNELVNIIEYLIAHNLSDMEKGKKGNPIHHNIQVLENMIQIASGLHRTNPVKYDYNWIKSATALALLHDIGNAELPKGTVKVKDSEIQDAILESLPGEVRDAVKTRVRNISYAIEYRKSNGYPREKVVETVKNAIAFRKAHMISGAEMIEHALQKLNADFKQSPYNYDDNVFSEDSIREIRRVVSIHDNPSIASYFEKYGVYIETGESASQYLFEDTDILALAMRDADRLWMISPEGLEKDLIDDVKSGKSADPENKLKHNIKRFEEEKTSYETAGKEADFLSGSLLFRTEGGNDIFNEFKSYWGSRIVLLESLEFLFGEVFLSQYFTKGVPSIEVKSELGSVSEVDIDNNRILLDIKVSRSKPLLIIELEAALRQFLPKIFDKPSFDNLLILINKVRRFTRFKPEEQKAILEILRLDGNRLYLLLEQVEGKKKIDDGMIQAAIRYLSEVDGELRAIIENKDKGIDFVKSQVSDIEQGNVTVEINMMPSYGLYQLKNNPKTLEHGMTCVIRIPEDTQANERMTYLINKVDGILNEVLTFDQRSSVFLKKYGPDQFHSTINPIVRGQYSKGDDTSQREGLKEAFYAPKRPINLSTALMTVARTKPFKLKYPDSFKINGQGEILVWGDSIKDSDGISQLSKMREEFVNPEKAAFDPRDADSKVHTTLGTIENYHLLTREQREEIARMISTVLENIGGFSFKVEDIYLVHYGDRGLAKFQSQARLRLGEAYNKLGPKELSILTKKVETDLLVRGTMDKPYTSDVLAKSSSSGTALKDLSDYDAHHYMADFMLKYAPTGIIEVPKDSQAIIVYSDALRESPALQDIIRQSAGDSRKFYLVNKKEGISTDEFLAELNIDKGIFQRHVFTQGSLSADQLALTIAGMLHNNGIKQGRVFASTEEDLAAWSKQGLIDALVMLLKDKRFEIISDYSQQHIEYIRTYEQALIAA